MTQWPNDPMTNAPIIQFLEALKNDIIHSMQENEKYATGQSASKMNITDEDDSASLQIPAYLQALEYGRGPTGVNAQSGSPPMIDRIREWCQAKGIPDKAVWAVKKTIDKKGYKGIHGLLTGPLGDGNINLHLDNAIAQISDSIAERIVDAIG